MNKLITFKHLTGSAKQIPGVKAIDCSPKLRMETVLNAEVSREIPGYKKHHIPVFAPDPNHKPQIVLMDEDFEPLSESDKKLPKRMRDQIEDKNAAEAITRREGNQRVMNALLKLVSQKEIEIVSITELTPQEVVNTKAPIVKMSEIQIADYLEQGKEIPPELIANNKQDIERIRAMQKISTTS